MFQVSEVIDAVKNLASTDPQHDRSHCQALEFHAKQLGFQSFHHLKRSLKRLPSDRIDEVSLKLMRQISLRRIPSLDCDYFEFMAADGNFGFYSYWIGWNKRGEEVRVPRPLTGPATAAGLRKNADFPIYVVESDKELLAWRYNWLSTALIPEQLARRFFPFSFNKVFMVEKNPPLAKIRARVNRDYSDNIAYG
jgi:hypothetical protein